MSFGTSVRRYYRGHRLVTMRSDTAGETRHYHFDHQGATQCLTDSTGAVTDRFAANAWGVQVKRSGSSINRHWYIGNLGYYRATTGPLTYVRRRYLAPSQGIWLTDDPWPTGDSYRYAGNTPVIMIDPSGLWKCRKLAGGRMITGEKGDELRVFLSLTGGGISKAISEVIKKLPRRAGWDCVAINGTFFGRGRLRGRSVSTPFGTVYGYGGPYKAPNEIAAGGGRRVRLVKRFYFGGAKGDGPILHGQGHPPASIGHGAGGLGRILDRGRPVGEKEMLAEGDFTASQVSDGRARTAVGERLGKVVLFATVQGMAMTQLAVTLKGVGVWTAYFADGGRSTEMIFNHHNSWSTPPAKNDKIIPQFYVLCQPLVDCVPKPDHREAGASPC